MKAAILIQAFKWLMGLIAIGIGVWYLSSSIGGEALTYTSMDNFLTAIGVQNGDISSANGCFLCGYVSELFTVIGDGAELFWGLMLDNIWLLLTVGFGIFLFIHSIKHIWGAAQKTATIDANDKKIDLQTWFDPVWKQGARVLAVGALLGMLGMGGTNALRTITDITITPVMLVGTELSMAATGVNDAASCPVGNASQDGILNPVLKPFMCVVGNLNSVMLAGAAGGFSLMNYAWLGLGGGVFTWLAGVALVIMFLIIGFNLFFQILSVIFKLVFLIIFLPLLLAAAAFEKTWDLANGVVSKAIDMLVKSAIQIVSMSLKTIIIFAIVAFCADEYFPAPNDGYSAILPPMMGQEVKNPDAKTLSVINVFATCEKVALTDGEMDADKFKDCFITQKSVVEQQYPNAFDFMDDGWDFALLMIFIFFIYFYAISSKIDKILGTDGSETFDFGNWTKTLGQNIWAAPQKIFEAATKKLSDK